MNKVMRWGACALMLCFAVALGPVFGQQAFADTTLNASDVEYADLVLEGDTVLNLDANIELTSIVSEDKLTIKGDGALTVNNKGGKAIEVKSLKIADGLEIAVPEDGKAKDGTIVDADGDAASKVKIKAKAVKQAALETEADEDEGEGDGAGGAGGLATQADSYIVTFNVQGHGTAPEDQTVEEGQTADDPATPTAQCYTFDGWYMEAACTNKYDFSTTVTANLTLYAKWTPAHKVSKVAKKDATCTEAGYKIDCWKCSACGKYFSAEAATDADILEESDVVIAAKGHNASHYAASDATCTAKGNIEYWYCSTCNKYFSNEALTTETTKAKTVVAALGHKLEHTAAKAATCTKAGNKEYWHCTRCDKYFSDAAGKTVIQKSSTKIAKLGHDWGEWTVVKEATTSEKGLKRRVCKNDSSHVQEKAIPIVIAYSYEKGANSSWTKGTKSGLEMVVKRNVKDSKTYGLFKEVAVDDKVIDSKYYSTAKGSLKLTLNQSYLESLSVAKHKVKVTFEDGDAETTITINASKSAASSTSAGASTPNTGDQIPVGAVVGIVLVAAAALAGVFVARRRMS